MEAERWRQISELYDAARARDGGQRAAFLHDACAGDAELRREVEWLLAQEDESFLETRPSGLGISDLRVDLIGRQIGTYKVLSLLGAGGMGEVYRARDTKLGRDVALKVLPARFTADRDRVARFEREARLLATLNHAHIGAIYGFENAGSVSALVLELVEGPTLADRLAKGPLPPTEALNIAGQIAEALEAAHEKGIIHRDLKPANINITPDGSVKVLDFGMAKAAAADTASPDLSQLATMTIGLTREGMIVGTPAYMSPEQTRGQPVDKRTDIWAFGCVLFEMLTRTPAFAAEDVSDTLAKVLTKDPEWDALPPSCPAAIRTLLRRCLAKDRRRRLADAASIRLEVEEAQVPPLELAIVSPQLHNAPAWRRIAAFMLAGGLIALAAGSTVWMWTQSTRLRVTRFTITPSANSPLTIEGTGRDLAVSPDGSRLVYVAANGTQLVVHAFDQLAPTILTGLGSPNEPVFSPDGEWIAYFDGVSTLKKVRVSGGPAVTVAPVLHQNGGASWGPDDRIVFAGGPPQGLLQVSATGGQPEVLARADPARGEWAYTQPEFLPGGNAVLLTIRTLEGDQVAALNLRTDTRTVLVRGGSHAHYVAPGYLVYAVKGTLWATAFDPGRLTVSGSPALVVEGVITTGGGVGGDYSVATGGTLVYVPGGPQVGVRRSLLWVDRQGREDVLAAPARAYVYPRLSPDDTRLAVSVADQENDIWIWNFSRQSLTKFTFGELFDLHPVWTPDGRRLLWGSLRSATGGATQAPNIYWQAADGTGPIEQLENSPTVFYPLTVTPDGTRLLVREDGPTTGHDLSILTLDGERRITPLIRTTLNERNAEISPDGRWIAYESNETGGDEVHVRSFPAVDGGRWQVSTNSGRQPRWSRDGRELFYRTPDGSVMAAQVEQTNAAQRGAGFTASTATVVFKGNYYKGSAGLVGRTYDVSADGQRFLMIKETDAPDNPAVRPSIIVVQNWAEELKRAIAR